MLPAELGQLLPEPLRIADGVPGEVDVNLLLPVRAEQQEALVQAGAVVPGDVPGNPVAVVAVPPLAVLVGPERHGDAAQVPAPGAGGGPAVAVYEEAGADHDEDDGKDEAEEPDAVVPDPGAAAVGLAEEVHVEAIDDREAAEEAVHHPPQVGEVVDEGGETNEAVDHHVQD